MALIKEINVGIDFYHRLTNRDYNQGDGKHTAAVDFRNKFLKELDSEDAWKNPEKKIILDFKEVKKIGPSFANEAFGYFTKYAEPGTIFKVIEIKNASNVQLEIIKIELDSARSGK